MTMPQTLVADTTAPPRGQTAHELAIELIVEETDCSPQEAQAAITWLERYIDGARQSDYATQYPSADELQDPAYRIVDTIMPHRAYAEPGTAHEAVQTLLLDPDRDEISLVHADDEDVEPGSPTYCQMRVGVSIL